MPTHTPFASLALVVFAGAAILGLSACSSTNSRSGMSNNAAQPDVAGAGLFFRTLTVGAHQHKYALYIPPSSALPSPAPSSLPLVVFLNGSGECGTDGVRQLTQGLFPAVLNTPKAWPMVIAFPQKPESDSEWEDHDALVMAAIADAKSQARIDTSRIYLTGLSQGGHGTWMIGAKHADFFAAIAPVCGYGPGGYRVPPDPASVAAIANQLQSMPVNAFHGALDDVVPANQTETMIAALRANTEARPEGTASSGTAQPSSSRLPDRLMTIYPDLNHGCWDRAYRDGGIAKWLLSHKR